MLKAKTTHILIETIVRQTIKDIKDSPERGIRRLVDMALEFSGGRFQKYFFSMAQTMLEDEKSEYYDVLRQLVSYSNTDRLVTFGMNLGYNSCTEGAEIIRSIEGKEGYNIPWTVALDIDLSQYPQRPMQHEYPELQNQCEYSKHKEQNEYRSQKNQYNFSECLGRYESVIAQGQELGIYSWQVHVNGCPDAMLPLAEKFPDSAFSLFCHAEDLDEESLDMIADLKNIMPVIYFESTESDIWKKLRDRGIFYSAYFIYEAENAEEILNADFFYEAQQVHPIFTVVIASPGCPEELRQQVLERIHDLRGSAAVETFPWEIVYDSCLVDGIISTDACSVRFDAEGGFHTFYNEKPQEGCNLFEDGLEEIFRKYLPKKA